MCLNLTVHFLCSQDSFNNSCDIATAIEGTTSPCRSVLISDRLFIKQSILIVIFQRLFQSICLSPKKQFPYLCIDQVQHVNNPHFSFHRRTNILTLRFLPIKRKLKYFLTYTLTQKIKLSFHVDHFFFVLWALIA